MVEEVLRSMPELPHIEPPRCPGHTSDVIGQRQEPLMQGPEDVGRALPRLDREVWPRHVPNEQRVSRQQRPPDRRRGCRLAQQEGGVLRAVARRVDRLGWWRPPSRSVQPSTKGSWSYSASASWWMWIVAPVARAQPPVAGDVVGVVVGLQHVLDSHPVELAQLQVRIDVPSADRRPRRRRLPESPMR